MRADDLSICSCGAAIGSCECQHRADEDCMTCSECGECDESCDDEGLCAECRFTA